MTVSKYFCVMDNNYLTASNLVASKEDSSYPIENILTTVRGQVFKPTSNNFNFTIDLSYNAEVKCIAMIGKLDSIFGISPSAVITVQANNINDFSGTTPYEASLTATYQGVYHFLHESYRYWKITINDSSPTVNEISYFYLGDSTQLETRTINRGFSSALVDPTRVITAMDGSIYFNEKPKYHVFSGLSMGYLSSNDREIIEKLYFDKGKNTPMLFSIDPTGQILSENIHQFTKLMIFEDAPTVSHEFNNLFSMRFDLREVI